MSDIQLYKGVSDFKAAGLSMGVNSVAVIVKRTQFVWGLLINLAVLIFPLYAGGYGGFASIKEPSLQEKDD